MRSKVDVFNKTYNNYLEQIRDVSFSFVATRLGLTVAGARLKIRLFNSEYYVSAEEICDQSGIKPPHDICVILSKYILLCPDNNPNKHDWVSYRDFRDSNPLISNFTNEVEGAIASCFSGRMSELEKASDIIGCYPANLSVRCDLAVQFQALPKIPIILLYNDADEEFPAKCSVLFESQAETYLDAESLAMLGRQFYIHLEKALTTK